MPNRRSGKVALLLALALPFLSAPVVKAQTAAAPRDVDRVDLQLKWVTQAQFAGYYAAQAKGFYARERLDVTIRRGAPDLTPEQVVARGGAPLAVGWLPSLLVAREQGAPL